jgi:hypothetical protein
MKISSVISQFLEENQLDSSLEELFKKYELFRAKAISSEGGRPKKYFTKEEKDEARRARQREYYKNKSR